MDVQVNLTAEEVKTAVKDYIHKQGMSLSVKEIGFVSGGAALVICEKVKPSNGYYDR